MPGPPVLRVAAALVAVFVMAAAAIWPTGEPSGLLVFLAVFFGGWLIGWVDAAPR
jgi:hypothetical protein